MNQKATNEGLISNLKSHSRRKNEISTAPNSPLYFSPPACAGGHGAAKRKGRRPQIAPIFTDYDPSGGPLASVLYFNNFNLQACIVALFSFFAGSTCRSRSEKKRANTPERVQAYSPGSADPGVLIPLCPMPPKRGAGISFGAIMGWKNDNIRLFITAAPFFFYDRTSMKPTPTPPTRPSPAPGSNKLNEDLAHRNQSPDRG